MDIQLFLSHADTHQPVLAEGIEPRAVHQAPRVPLALPGSGRRANVAPPDALPQQRWAVIAPEGAAGDRSLRLIDPLLQARAEEQKAEALVYRVDPGMDLSAASAWMQNDYWNAVKRREEHLPRYLLIVGSPELVSWDLQQLLGSEAFVGRLDFPTDDGYEAYVDKVLRWERCDPEPGARALLYTVRDGSKATADGYRCLMHPTLEIAQDRRDQGMFPATELLEIGGGDRAASSGELHGHAERMLREAEHSRAGLLFSMSHGAGAPRAGWTSAAEQRALQGAMQVSRSGNRITAADIATRSFLPGGVWFLFACYGAGTPAQSAYYTWLDRLHGLGVQNAAEWVLAALPKQGEKPFVAALPQAALANPNGPVGVIGHVDLAWTWSFLDLALPGHQTAAQPRAERFQGVLQALVQGHRIGVAHHELAQFFRSVSMELSALYDENARLGIAIDSDTEDETRKVKRASLWMQRQDLCAYVLLGDPAARLPIALYPAGVRRPEHGQTGAGHTVRLQEAVLAALREPDATGAIARRHGIAEAELLQSVDTFIRAGRAALRGRR